MMVRTNRREFLVGSAQMAAAIGAASMFGQNAFAAGPTVAVVRNERAIDDKNFCDKVETRKLVDRTLSIVSGQKDPGDAWAALGVTKTDTVAIKINCNSATFALYAHPELVFALCDSLSTVVPANNIIIYDRSEQDLKTAGYSINTSNSGVRVIGADTGEFSTTEELTNIITDRATKLVNLPSLKMFGGDFTATICLKNHVGSLPRAQMSKCHGNAVMLGEIAARPSIRAKTVLALCDGLRGTYDRGVPWFWKGLVASRDPLAVEVTGLSVINERRKQQNLAAIELLPFHKEAESIHKVGIADSTKLTVVTVTL